MKLEITSREDAVTINGFRNTHTTLHRRFSVEASTTPLLSVAEEQRLTRRINTARRRLLAALATWPPCAPQLLEDYSLASHRTRVIVSILDTALDAAANEAETTQRIGAHLSQLNDASRYYLAGLATYGWAHAETRQRRRTLAALLSALRLNHNYLQRLMTQADAALAFHDDAHCLNLRARIAAARRALDTEKEHLVHANLRLVIAVARRYRYCDVAQADLIQEGNMGLLRAVEKFDHRRGCKFSTYAIWWIQRAIVLTITLQRSVLSVPAYALQAAQRVRRRATDPLWQGEQTPGFAELAAMESMSSTDLRAAQSACLPAIPLHGDGDDEFAPINILHDTQQLDPCDALQQSQLQQRVHNALTHLPLRQAQILRLRYGIGIDEPHTLDAIGQQLGLSRERIRQIEQQALNQLRRSKHAQTLAPLLDPQPSRPTS